MKKILFFTALLFCISAISMQAQDRNLVTTTGEGIVKVEPDEVTIKSRIEHEGSSASDVQKQNDEVVSKIIAYLKSKGIAEKNIQTQYVNLNKNHNYNNDTFTYVANQAISIKLTDISRYEEIMKGLLDNGLNRIDGIQFSSSEMEKYEEEARKKAVLDAKTKAEQLTKPLGQSIGMAFTISEMEMNHIQPLYRMDQAVMSEAQSSGQTMAPGEMEIKIRVNVGFELN